MSEIAPQRGDVIVYAVSGDYGKPRPGVVVQSDLFNETHASVVVCPVSSELTGLDLFRVGVGAGAASGLKKASEVMVDKLAAVRRDRVARRIGKLGRVEMGKVDEALARLLGLSA